MQRLGLVRLEQHRVAEAVWRAVDNLLAVLRGSIGLMEGAAERAEATGNAAKA